MGCPFMLAGLLIVSSPYTPEARGDITEGGQAPPVSEHLLYRVLQAASFSLITDGLSC